MKSADLLARASDWSGETWAGRIDQCASMLFCHGYIPMSARDRIGRKLEQQLAKLKPDGGMTADEQAELAALDAYWPKTSKAMSEQTYRRWCDLQVKRRDAWRKSA